MNKQACFADLAYLHARKLRFPRTQNTPFSLQSGDAVPHQLFAHPESYLWALTIRSNLQWGMDSFQLASSHAGFKSRRVSKPQRKRGGLLPPARCSPDQHLAPQGHRRAVQNGCGNVSSLLCSRADLLRWMCATASSDAIIIWLEFVHRRLGGSLVTVGSPKLPQKVR